MNSVVHRQNIDLKLLDYEQTVAAAATSGIDMETKDVIYQWSYIQAVFFTSTILTTIGRIPNFCCRYVVILFIEILKSEIRLMAQTVVVLLKNIKYYNTYCSKV